ncbi:MAG TPA: LURP-one-related family protein [Streptosporangiaceae bacterium]|nr:LURP-one-related family protein [Streptosporangiaceae bacterium]
MYLIREKMFRLAEDSDITDETGRLVLRVDGELISLHSRLVVQDPAGCEVAQISRKLVSLRPTYEISVDGQQVAEVRKHLFTPFREQFTIAVPDGRDMELAGDLLSHEFTIERDGQTVATISKRWLSLTDSYAVDVTSGENDLLVLASVLALDLALDQQRHAA